MSDKKNESVNFLTAVKDLMDKAKCSEAEALRVCAEKYSGLYKDFCSSEDQQKNLFRELKGLQAEFGGDEDAYLAFIEAEKEGRAGIIGGKTVSSDA